MKWFSSQNVILLVILLLSSNFVSSQISDPKEILGVEAGDTFTYVISRKLGIEGPVFFDGFSDLNLDDGDSFNLTVLSTIPTLGGIIDLELWNQESNVTYANNLAFFDFISFIDWDYTISLLEEFNLEFYIDEETIHFTFFIQPTVDEVTYFEYSYIIETGVLLHKLEYTASNSDFQNPSRILQIDLGNSPLPRPNVNNIGFEVGDFYLYDMIQIQGFEDLHVFQGKNSTLDIKEGDQFAVTPLSTEINSVHSVPLSFQTIENGITYDNKLDFQNSVNNPSFLIYTDWDYVENLVEIFESNADDGRTFEYLTTSTKFIYKESFVNVDSYYALELHYDLVKGVLLYESLVLENYLNVSFGIIEFQLNNLDNINQDNLSIDLDLTYNYNMVKYESTSFKPFFISEDGNLWLFSGDTFSISPISAPNSKNENTVSIEVEGDVIQSVNEFDSLGSFFIFTDWEYWNDLVLLLDDFSPVETNYQLITANSEVKYIQTVETSDLQIVETVIYDESSGVLNYYTLEITGTDQTGQAIFTSIEVELNNITPQLTSQIPEETSSGDDGLIQLLPFMLLAGIMILVLMQQKQSK